VEGLYKFQLRPADKDFRENIKPMYSMENSLNRLAMRTTLVFAKAGRTEAVFQLFFSLWLHIGQDIINLAKCKSSTFIYKFSFR
jgi:hypothetical protein